MYKWKLNQGSHPRPSSWYHLCFLFFYPLSSFFFFFCLFISGWHVRQLNLRTWASKVRAGSGWEKMNSSISILGDRVGRNRDVLQLQSQLTWSDEKPAQPKSGYPESCLGPGWEQEAQGSFEQPALSSHMSMEATDQGSLKESSKPRCSLCWPSW